LWGILAFEHHLQPVPRRHLPKSRRHTWKALDVGHMDRQWRTTRRPHRDPRHGAAQHDIVSRDPQVPPRACHSDTVSRIELTCSEDVGIGGLLACRRMQPAPRAAGTIISCLRFRADHQPPNHDFLARILTGPYRTIDNQVLDPYAGSNSGASIDVQCVQMTHPRSEIEATHTHLFVQAVSLPHAEPFPNSAAPDQGSRGNVGSPISPRASSGSPLNRQLFR